MVNVEKQRIKRIMKFKNDAINALISSKLTFIKREVDQIIYEDILFEGRKLAHFKYDKGLMKFELVGDEKCAEESESIEKPMNNLPQS